MSTQPNALLPNREMSRTHWQVSLLGLLMGCPQDLARQLNLILGSAGAVALDNRSLRLSQVRGDDVGIYFAVDRAKTGMAAAGTMTKWSQAVLVAYHLTGFGADLLTACRCSGRAAAVL